MDRQLKFTILPITGARTNSQRMMAWRVARDMKRRNPDLAVLIELYSPAMTKRRKRLAPELAGSLLTAFLYGLIALAVFEGVTR